MTPDIPYENRFAVDLSHNNHLAIIGEPNRELDDALSLIGMVAEMLTQVITLDALTEVPGRWIDAVHDKQPPKVITLGMDSSESPESPVHSGQEGAMRNGLFQFKCLHSILVLNQYGDIAHWHPVAALYCIALQTWRMSLWRGRPNFLRRTRNGSIKDHSSSLQSLAER
jgi:hypothetical protein